MPTASASSPPEPAAGPPGAGGLWRRRRPLLLASASATRARLLASAGIPFEMEPSAIDERPYAEARPGLDPARLAEELAVAKAADVSQRHPGRVVLGADQVLACEGELVFKASGPDAAARRIAALSGRAHRLHSAFAITIDGACRVSGVEQADLTMRALDAAAIARYVALAGHALTRSVGCYEIEALGIHLFERVEGEHTTILGLPLVPVLRGLRGLDLLAV